MAARIYEKPNVVNLNVLATQGAAPFSCVDGPSAGFGESCLSGGSAGYACGTGSSDAHHQVPCSAGNAVEDGACIYGTSPGDIYCEGGSGGYNNYGCNVGPSVT